MAKKLLVAFGCSMHRFEGSRSHQNPCPFVLFVKNDERVNGVERRKFVGLLRDIRDALVVRACGAYAHIARAHAACGLVACLVCAHH